MAAPGVAGAHAHGAMGCCGGVFVFDPERLPSIGEQTLQDVAPHRGFAVVVEGCEQVLIDTNEIGLDAVVIGVMAVFAIVPGVGGVELGGGGGDLCRAAGQGRDAGSTAFRASIAAATIDKYPIKAKSDRRAPVQISRRKNLWGTKQFCLRAHQDFSARILPFLGGGCCCDRNYPYNGP
jgi:hypothetical protein